MHMVHTTQKVAIYHAHGTAHSATQWLITV